MFDVFAFSILVPLLIGFMRFNKIHNSYRPFIYLLMVTTLNTVNYKYNPSLYGKHLGSHIAGIVESVFMLTLLLRWNKNKLSYKLKCLLKAALVVFQCIGMYLISGNTYATNWPQLIVLAILTAYGFNILTQQVTPRFPDKKAIPKKLIIIPFILSSIYFIAIKITLYFLYNPANEPLFIELYSLMVIVNLLSYISYSLALLWAPKKEKYL